MENAVNDRINLRNMCLVGLMAAVTCVLAPLSIPIGPIPISLTNLAVYLSLYLLGMRLGVLSYLVYVLLGMAGLPVFSGFVGGLGKLMEPTGGYIIGFIPMGIIGGAALERFSNRALQFLALSTGTAVCYALGTAWFCVVMRVGVVAALSQTRTPFYSSGFGQNHDCGLYWPRHPRTRHCRPKLMRLMWGLSQNVRQSLTGI